MGLGFLQGFALSFMALVHQVGKNLEMGKFLVGFYGVFALGSTGRFGLLASTRSRDRVRIPINPISGQAFYLGRRLGACAVGGGCWPSSCRFCDIRLDT